MSRTMRAGVIGAGSMGANHARVYADLEGVELVAIAEPDLLTANHVAQKYRCACYTDHGTMLKHERLDLVSVVVPTHYHYAVAADVIAAGVALLIEKPIAATLDQGRMLIDAARERDVPLTVGHIERFNPAIRALKERLAANELGHVYQISARRVGPFPTRVRDVGVVIDLATHEMDILHYLMGEDITRMHVELGRRVHRSHEDQLSAILRFQGGVIGPARYQLAHADQDTRAVGGGRARYVRGKLSDAGSVVLRER